jgi:hypothetical protein
MRDEVDNLALVMEEVDEKPYKESDGDGDDFSDYYEEIWKPPPSKVTGADVDFMDEPEDDFGLSREARLAAEDAFRKSPVIEKYPDSHAGAPVTHDRMASRNEAYAKSVNNNVNNPWAPFVSQIDWEIAQWANFHGPGSTAMSDILKFMV